jgi:hypothetical protein
MWKVEVLLDEGKIKNEGRYNLNELYTAIDKTFIKGAQMERHYVEPDGTRIYIASAPQNKDHYSKIGLAITAYAKQKWFTDNALKFIYGNSHGSDNPDDFSREDILQVWEVGKSIA